MKKDRSHCPINYSLEIFGDKWTLLIIRDLLLLKKKTYSDFKNAPEGIATNILADRLNLLEKQNIITRTVDPNNNKIYFYNITQKGLDLLPIILEIAVWGATHDKKTEAPQKLIKQIKENRAKVINAITDALTDPSKTIFDKN